MFSLWNKASDWLENKKAIAGLLLFLICLTYFGWLQWQPSFPDPDSFYHIKMSQLMASGQIIIKNFPWLQQTTLKGNYIDQHFLYHLLMVPFVKYFNPFIGAKLFQAILASILILIFYLILKKLEIKKSFWWSLSLLLSQGFIFRINLIKAQPLALIIFFLALYLIIQKRYWLLFILAPIYIWSYGGWFFLVVLSVTYALADLWDEKRDRKFLENISAFFKLDNLKLFFTTTSGLLLGLIINPYFPQNLKFYWQQIVQIGLINSQSNVTVGAEWYSPDPLVFLQTNFFCIVLIILASIIFWEYKNQLSKREKYFFILFCLFILATIKARRNLEYLIPITTLFAATVFNQANQIPKIKNDLIILKNKLKDFLFFAPQIKIFLIVTLLLATSFVLFNLPIQEKNNLEGLPTLQRANNFIIKNIPAQETIFNADWDFWPQLFYYNDKNYYLVGMDPTFMYLKSPSKYKEWHEIITGKDKNNLAQKIKTDFNSRYIISAKTKKDTKDFIINLNNNPDFVNIYEDSEAIIYKIK